MNRALAFLATLLILSAVMISPARADGDMGGDDAVRKWGLGIEGLGNEYDDAHPTLRWNFKPTWSLDATPILSYSRSDPGGQPEVNQNYGLDLGLVKWLSNTHGLRFGLAGLAGYTYGSSFSTNLFPTVNNYITRSFVMRLGVGPELEYPIPLIPRLTVGAQVFLRYAYGESWGFNQTLNKPNSPTVTTQNLGFIGETLAVRYYF